MKVAVGSRCFAFTLVEMMIATGIFTIVALVGYLLISSSSVLLAENISLNHTNTTVRGSLDRLSAELNQAVQYSTVANGQTVLSPGTLLNSDSSTYTGSGSAAGILFDRFIGGPFVANDSSTSIATNATSFALSASKTSFTSPPTPQVNDVAILQSDTSQRPLIRSVSSSTSGTNNLYTVTVTPAFATAITWVSGMKETAYLVHRKAIIVVPNGANYEMRLYPDAESLSTSNYNNSSSYVVLTTDIGKNSGENTPFSLSTQNGSTFLSIAMRVNDQLYNNYLATRQATEFNTFLRADAMMRPRNTY